MINFFSKKLNKKGFTLAELLIVVAIIAILIAVAIPIYTGAMKEAQKKVNMSNARALKGAATSYILMHWTEEDSSSKKYSTGADKPATGGGSAPGWIAWAAFDNNGNMSAVKVRVAAATEKCASTHVEAYTEKGSDDELKPIDGATAVTEPATFSTAVPVNGEGSGAVTNPNVIIVHINGTEISK